VNQVINTKGCVRKETLGWLKGYLDSLVKAALLGKIKDAACINVREQLFQRSTAKIFMVYDCGTFPTFKGSRPWPWIRSYCILSYITQSTSTYIPNVIKIEENFCGRKDGQTFFYPYMLLCRLGGVDLKMKWKRNNMKQEQFVVDKWMWTRFGVINTHYTKLSVFQTSIIIKEQHYWV